jgi:hypothetical protein
MPAAPRANASHQYVDSQNVSLKEHYDGLIEQVCKTLDERFKAQEKALELQQDINEKRFEAQNEWRGAMNDREKAYITRADHEALVLLLNTKEDNLKKDIKSLEITRATLDGKASQSQVNITFAFTFFSLILAVIGIILGFYGH